MNFVMRCSIVKIQIQIQIQIQNTLLSHCEIAYTSE